MTTSDPTWRGGRLPSASQPTTPSQRERYDSLIAHAGVLLASGGEDGLTMKELSQRAGVALSTVYRYFPSKQWLILAVAVHRRWALSADSSRPVFHTGKPSERAAGWLLENFRHEQSEPLLIAAIRRAGYTADRETRAVIEQLRDGFLQNLIEDAGPFAAEQMPVLDLIVEVADQVSSRAGAGLLTQREARFRLLTVCALLDLGSETLDDLAAAAVASG